MTIETKTAVRKLGDGSIPAAGPLTGDEVVIGLQDGESVEIAAQDIADLAGGGGAGYAYSGTYTPTVVTDGAGAVASYSMVGPGSLGVLRVGAGSGVPSIGDTVVVTGAIGLESMSDGDAVTVTTPFEVSTNVYPVLTFAAPVVGPPSDIVLSGVLTDFSTLQFTVSVSVDTDGLIPFSLTYQTANAVDP